MPIQAPRPTLEKITTWMTSAPRKRPAEIVELGDGRGEEEIGRTAVDVLIGRLSGDGRRHYKSEETSRNVMITSSA